MATQDSTNYNVRREDAAGTRRPLATTSHVTRKVRSIIIIIIIIIVVVILVIVVVIVVIVLIIIA